MKKLILPVLLAAFIGGTSACTPTIDNRGNLPHPDDLAKIVAGTTTRDEVQVLLGTPSSSMNYGDESWQYISSVSETTAFFKPEVKDRKVVSINFDMQGIVKNVTYKGLNDGQEIVLVDRETPTAGKELGILEQLMGNVGRCSKPSSGGGLGQ
jgi:outer membrane protein assembly factor BamE (lipoprotein component of BamABCDE complex)